VGEEEVERARGGDTNCALSCLSLTFWGARMWTVRMRLLTPACARGLRGRGERARDRGNAATDKSATELRSRERESASGRGGKGNGIVESRESRASRHRAAFASLLTKGSQAISFGLRATFNYDEVEEDVVRVLPAQRHRNKVAGFVKI
jgi:hypothetical protein